jgi:hypothetical protein
MNCYFRNVHHEILGEGGMWLERVHVGVLIGSKPNKNKGMSPRRLKIRKYVWLRTHPFTYAGHKYSAKPCLPSCGPFTIESNFSPVSLRLEDPNTGS